MAQYHTWQVDERHLFKEFKPPTCDRLLLRLYTLRTSLERVHGGQYFVRGSGPGLPSTGGELRIRWFNPTPNSNPILSFP